jgi:hypothetical protein
MNRILRLSASIVAAFFLISGSHAEEDKSSAAPQTIHGRGARGGATGVPSPRVIPKAGDPVGPPLPPPPFPVQDLKGLDLADWYSREFSCNADWKHTCEDTVRIDLDKGTSYCSHNLHISEWNNAEVRVTTAPAYVEVWFRLQSGDFSNQYGANIRATLVVAATSGSPFLSCLPTRSWSAYVHGKNGNGYFNDRCATMPAFKVPYDAECAKLEQYPVSGNGIQSAPCPSCGADPSNFPQKADPVKIR